MAGAAAQVKRDRERARTIPNVGRPPAARLAPTRSRAPRGTSPRSTRGGRSRASCTRRTSRTSLGKKPVALLFATPQLCQSRVCGPVVDIALQMKQQYGDRMAFIHQEVYRDNQVSKGLRPPLQAFHLQTEPWLFTIDSDGRIAARLEGSFGVNEFRQAIQAALKN